MKVNLWEMERKEIKKKCIFITHYNLYHNDVKKYDCVYKQLKSEGVSGIVETLCFITNTARAIKFKSRGMKSPRSRKSYKGSKVKHLSMVRVFDKLEELGYVDTYIGGFLGDEDTTITSFIMFTPKLLKLFEGIKNVGEADKMRLVSIRNRDTKEELSTKGVKGVGDMSKDVKQFNIDLQRTEIMHNGEVIPVQQYRRIFSGDIDKGGRYYNSAGGVQTMSADERSKLLIDGEEVIELDFRAMHPSLLYESMWNCDKDAVEVWLEKNGGEYDPYNADFSFIEVDEIAVKDHALKYELHNYNPTRNLAKTAMMMLMNCDNVIGAMYQITQSLKKDAEKDEASRKYVGIHFYRGFPSDKVCEALEEHNHLISQHFYEDVGIDLQFVDSEIMRGILNKLHHEGEVALPSHDSVVVRKSIKDLALRAMRESYLEQMHSDVFCYIK